MRALAARPPEPFDELMLRRAQRGEEPAWRVLIERYQAPVHAVIWRMLAGRQLDRAEDLVQETFLRVLRALPAFDPAGPASLATWILTIAARLALNELRRPEPAALPEAWLDAPSSARSERADVGAERRRLGDAIQAGVAALPVAQRAVFILREYHDLDYRDIATALKIDLGTVKSRLARARAALRVHLEAALPELKERT